MYWWIAVMFLKSDYIRSFKIFKFAPWTIELSDYPLWCTLFIYSQTLLWQVFYLCCFSLKLMCFWNQQGMPPSWRKRSGGRGCKWVSSVQTNNARITTKTCDIFHSNKWPRKSLASFQYLDFRWLMKMNNLLMLTISF